MLARERRVDLKPTMIVNEEHVGQPAGLVDEQKDIIGPPAGKPFTTWEINSRHNREYPFSVYLDLGKERNLSTLWVFDTNGQGDLVVSVGKPGTWHRVAVYGCMAYMKWASIPLDVTTRYLRLTKESPQANVTEIAVYEYTPQAHKAMLARKTAETAAKARREAALKKAGEELKKRPLVEAGPPFGKLRLVDEVDCARTPPDHRFSENPANHSRIETILGRKCRVIPPAAGECAYISYRIGKMKLLQAGAPYVLSVEYPEDAPRSMVIISTGNETSRGFHTGLCVGDALHPVYVNNLNESVNVPLSGRWERWSLMFRLHDRFPERGLIRGVGGDRPLTPEDGFDVTIAQFSARNAPMSKGAAVARIRLFAVTDPEALVQPLKLPPSDLPHRRLFWREEMADGVIQGRKPAERGLKNRLDWYRHKAELMRFLGMNTYTKDLLEFGACQHWDPSPYGGNEWVHYNADTKGLWAEIVSLMGKYGFDILPYYEYSGSKGDKGLGYERRCKPLTRDDAYTHIPWVEKANADITDPDTYQDFKNMLDLTVLRLSTRARFAGIWLRPRSQLPVSFAAATRQRFAAEANQDRPVTRADLKTDQALYIRYLKWWGEKRRAFLVAMRDYLRENGLSDAVVLFTGCPAEPGVGFHSWEPRLVTDAPDIWKPILARQNQRTAKNEIIRTMTITDVVKRDLYLEGLTAPGLNWGKWEVHHARPADDPQRYRAVDGVLLTHAFNRLYTVASSRTFDAFRTLTGLAVVRHYALNENMMFDRNDKSKLGYFVADIERAGPYCMMAEAVAMANGNPTMIGYLTGANFGRGFPFYVKNFNANFLALPALPGRRLPHASSDPEVVVRIIPTANHGTWFSVVNAGLEAKKDVIVRLPGKGPINEAVTGIRIAESGRVPASFYPCELKAWHRPGPK